MRCHWHRMQKKFFGQLQKVKIICKTAMVCKKIKNACGVIDTASKIWHRMHDRRTIRTALAGNIYQKHLCSRIVLPTTKKYINLKGLPNKKFSCMRCHWHRMHDFYVRKSIKSQRIRSRIKKGFSPWIRGPGGIIWWKKTRGSKISWHCPFKDLASGFTKNWTFAINGHNVVVYAHLCPAGAVGTWRSELHAASS
jgi:hypothetical protein